MLTLVLVVLATLAFLNLASFAYQQLGLSTTDALLLLLASLVGSQINVPVARLRGEPVRTARVVTVFGVRYEVPQLTSGTMILAVNLGGALIPTGVSVWLLTRQDIWRPALLATLVVALVSHAVARPVAGVGIVLPAVVPPLAAATAAILLSRAHAAPVAYVAGTLGTLIGADLTNLHRLRETGAPVASIGGAGTFDGIFLSGVMAVVLASGP